MLKPQKNVITHGKTKKVKNLDLFLVTYKLIKFNNEFFNLKEVKNQHGFTIDN